jgi:hypothetical protein
MDIFIKKEGSDKNGNHAGFDFGKVIIDFKSEKVYLEVEKQHKDSNNEVITSKGWKSHELPPAAFNWLLSAAKLTRLTEYGDGLINAPEPEAEPEA